MEKNLLIQEEVKDNSIIETIAETIAEPAEEKKEMVLKNDVKMPPRVKIREELKKVSNFSEEEISILYWSSLYKAYSLIVRYEQTGVEDEFRKESWFQESMKNLGSSPKIEKPLRTEKSSKKAFDYSKSEKTKSEKSKVDKAFDYSAMIAESQTATETIPTETKELLKQKQKESKKIIKEMKAIDKLQAKELKKNLKLQKKQFKTGEITLDKFFEFINTILGVNQLQPTPILAVN